MNDIQQWDIVVLPFPFTDKNSTKNRPALVVSSNQTIKDYDLIWVCMITSAKNEEWVGDVRVDDLEYAKLPAVSYIRPVKIACIEQNHIRKKLGTISNSLRDKVKGEILKTMGY